MIVFLINLFLWLTCLLIGLDSQCLPLALRSKTLPLFRVVPEVQAAEVVIVSAVCHCPRSVNQPDTAEWYDLQHIAPVLAIIRGLLNVLFAPRKAENIKLMSFDSFHLHKALFAASIIFTVDFPLQNNDILLLKLILGLQQKHLVSDPIIFQFLYQVIC